MAIVKEFKEFVSRGNVMDLAVGVIIGAAFGKIISSMVDNILMPLIGILLQGVNFEKMMIRVGEAEVKYGVFIAAIIDFLIIALVLFLLIRAVNNFKKKEAVAPTVAPAPTRDQELLMEIRDALKKNS